MRGPCRAQAAEAAQIADAEARRRLAETEGLEAKHAQLDEEMQLALGLKKKAQAAAARAAAQSLALQVQLRAILLP